MQYQKAFEEHESRGVPLEEANRMAQRVDLWNAFNYDMNIKRKNKVEQILERLKLTFWGQKTAGKCLTHYSDE